MGSVLTRRRRRAASSDAALILRAREGDLEAYGQLFERHEASARGLARQLSNSMGEADDVVSEAFERVLAAIGRGTGPQDSFRPYLLTAIRRTVYDRSRREKRSGPTSDSWVLDTGVEDADPSLAAFERDALARALSSLPERWQTVLWHTEVEETAPDDLAAILGMRPNALAALAYRAREGLRQAYMSAHVEVDVRSSGECRWTLERLPKFVRGRLSDDASLRIDRHLETCDDCRVFYLEMADVGVSLQAVMVPLVFGSPAVLAAVKAAGSAVTAGAGLAGVAGMSAGGAASSGAAVAGTGAAAAGTSSVVAGVAAATVAATVGGALVLPVVTTNNQGPPPAAVAAASGRTLVGITEPVVIETTTARSPAPAPAAAPATPTTEAEPQPDSIAPDGSFRGDIGTPLVIARPAPSAPEATPDGGTDDTVTIMTAPPRPEPTVTSPAPAGTPTTDTPTTVAPTTVAPTDGPTTSVPTTEAPSPNTTTPVSSPRTTVPPTTVPPTSLPLTSVPPTTTTPSTTETPTTVVEGPTSPIVDELD